MTTEDTVREVIAKVGLWWPAADEDKLRAAATAYRAFATDIDGLAQRANTAATAVTTANQAASIDQFRTLWQNYDGSYQGYLPGLASGARAMASACEQFADAVVQAKDKVRELAIEIGATLVVGAVLAIFTFSLSADAAVAVSATLVAEAAAIGVTLSETAAMIVATALVGAAFGAVEGAAVDVAVAQPIRVLGFHDGGFSLSELESSFVYGGGTGFVLGGGGGAFRALRNMPVGRFSSVISVDTRLAGLKSNSVRKKMMQGYDPYGGMTPKAFRDRFWVPAKNGRPGHWDYPPHHGGVPGTQVVRNMQKGQLIDRFGRPDGTFLSPRDTPFPKRALTPESIGHRLPNHPAGQPFEYHQYRVLKPFPVEAAKVAPAFGQPGGGWQFRVLPHNGTDIDVEWLVRHHYLQEIS